MTLLIVNFVATDSHTLDGVRATVFIVWRTVL
jgi:hypothetical protein